LFSEVINGRQWKVEKEETKKGYVLPKKCGSSARSTWDTNSVICAGSRLGRGWYFLSN